MKPFCSILLCLLTLAAGLPAKAAAEEKKYTYEMMTNQLHWLKGKYPQELQLKTIGVSYFGRNIYAVKLGTGGKNILLVGAHHAREWLTSLLLMQMLEAYAQSYHNHELTGNFSTEILNQVSIWFVPMLNPDGVTIQQNKIASFPDAQQKRLMFLNEGWDDFIRWKANGMGIDLNRQYPPGWNRLPKESNRPSYQFYKGRKPLEAAEVVALTNFVKDINPMIAVAYHTAGREIYWKYKNGNHLHRDHRIAKKIAKLTKYKLAEPPKEATGGGFTDWFITSCHRPGLTIEISHLVGDRHPPLSVFKEEWKRNRFVGLMLAEEAGKMAE